nr:MAG TPA: hypothetical protein [Caudoviricetes sp.]
MHSTPPVPGCCVVVGERPSDTLATWHLELIVCGLE